MRTDSVSFGAIPINKVKIKKYNKLSQTFMDYPANFVKIEADNKGDLEALDVVAKKWKGAKYVQQISTSAHWMKDRQIQVYALTNQSCNFEKLQANNILGLVEMRTDKNNTNNTLLHYLQVRPLAMNVNQKHKINYKYVGSSIISSLKKIYKEMSLFSDNDIYVEKFYQKNGFVDDFNGSRHYVWSSNIFKMLKQRILKFRLESGI